MAVGPGLDGTGTCQLTTEQQGASSCGAVQLVSICTGCAAVVQVMSCVVKETKLTVSGCYKRGRWSG